MGTSTERPTALRIDSGGDARGGGGRGFGAARRCGAGGVRACACVPSAVALGVDSVQIGSKLPCSKSARNAACSTHSWYRAGPGACRANGGELRLPITLVGGQAIPFERESESCKCGSKAAEQYAPPHISQGDEPRLPIELAVS